MMEVYNVVANDDVYAICSNRNLATRLVEEAKKDYPGSNPKIYTMSVMETLKDAGLE